jgi:hypothetical protein
MRSQNLLKTADVRFLQKANALKASTEPLTYL